MKRLRWGLIESFVIIIVLLFGFDLAWQYYNDIQHATRAAQNRARQISQDINNNLGKMTAAAEAILLSARTYHRTGISDLTDPRFLNTSFMGQMNVHPFITSINTGDSRGNGYLIMRSETAWKNRIKKSQEKGMVTWQELDANGIVLAVEKRPDDYDPRTRPWYVKALRQEGIVWSDPYIFRTTRDVGITASLRFKNGSDEQVAGVDIMLQDLAALLSEQTRKIPGQTAYLLTTEGLVLASSELDHFQGLLKKGELSLPHAKAGALPLLTAAIQAEVQGETPGLFTFEGRKFFAVTEPVTLSAGRSLSLVLALPREALMGDFSYRALGQAGIFILAILAACVWYIRRYLLPIKKIAATLTRIATGELQPPGSGEARNDEIGYIANELLKMEKELIRQGDQITQSSRLWRNSVDSLDVFLSVHDSQCRILKVNRPLADFLGTTPRELIGLKCHEVMHGTALPTADCPHQQTIATGGPAQTEVFFPASGRHFLVKTSPLVSPEGDASASIHIMRDITLEKKSRENLLASEAKYFLLSQEYYAILNSIPDSITVFDREFRVVWANNTHVNELGLSPGEVLGRHCYELSYQRNSPCPEDMCPAARTFRTGQGERQTKINMSGRIKDQRCFPIFGNDNTVVKVLEIDRDVTEHRALEDQLQQSRKMEAVGQLTGGIAHDFNNIITVIMGYAHILQMKLGPGTPQKEVAEIIKATERAASLTKSLLAFSRRQKIQLVPVGLNKILDENKILLGRLLGADLKLDCVPAEDDPVIIADSSLIGQVLINLTANARDALLPGGLVTIVISRVKLGFGQKNELENMPPGDYGLLSIADNGTGMDAETRARIFEPFFTTKGVGQGTGLGLSIAYGIVQQHRGAIICESSPGKGSTFKIYLPLAEERWDGPTSTPAESGPSKGGNETILLAEDDETLRELANTVLGQAGYRVILARNGKEALEKFKEHQGAIDIVLLDMIMPEMNGHEVYQAAQMIRPGVKVLFISGYTANILHNKGLSVHAQGIELLMKPVSPAVLLRKVREVLDRGRQR